MATLRTRKITRDKLATFLPSHELIKAFENLIQDVEEVVPDANISQDTADSALSEAAAARAVAESVKKLVLALGAAPPPAPAARSEPVDDLASQVATLQSLVARLTQRVENLEEGPTP